MMDNEKVIIDNADNPLIKNIYYPAKEGRRVEVYRNQNNSVCIAVFQKEDTFENCKGIIPFHKIEDAEEFAEKFLEMVYGVEVVNALKNKIFERAMDMKGRK